MSRVGNKERYLANIRKFLAGEISGEDFCNEHCFLWRNDRDEVYAVRETWPKRYDLDLIYAHRDGKLTHEEFKRQWDKLWGLVDQRAYNDLLDRLWSACDVFRPNPKDIDDAEHQYTERQLKDYVAKVYAEYEADPIGQ